MHAFDAVVTTTNKMIQIAKVSTPLTSERTMNSRSAFRSSGCPLSLRSRIRGVRRNLYYHTPEWLTDRRTSLGLYRP